MAKLFVPRALPASASLGIFLLRVTAGVALFLYGLPKLQNLTTWGQGMGFPDALLPVAAIAECIGGGLLAVGFLSPVAALGCAGVMGGAVWFHVTNGHPFVPSGADSKSWSLAAIYLAVAVTVLLTGPGRISVDAVAFKGKA